jgi:hypothetical protein
MTDAPVTKADMDPVASLNLEMPKSSSLIRISPSERRMQKKFDGFRSR